MKETLQLIVCKILTICKIFAYPKWCRIFSIHSITRFCQFGGPKDPKGLGFCSWGSLFPSYGTSKTICTSEGEIAVREPMFPRFEGGRTRKTNFFWVDPESCESCTGSILVLGDLLNRLKSDDNKYLVACHRRGCVAVTRWMQRSKVDAWNLVIPAMLPFVRTHRHIQQVGNNPMKMFWFVWTESIWMFPKIGVPPNHPF